jgi:hypothetical protein
MTLRGNGGVPAAPASFVLAFSANSLTTGQFLNPGPVNRADTTGTETQCQYVLPPLPAGYTSWTIAGLVWSITGAVAVSDAVTVGVRVGGINTLLQATLPSGGPVNDTQYDLVNSFAAAPGSRISAVVVVGAGVEVGPVFFAAMTATATV